MRHLEKFVVGGGFGISGNISKLAPWLATGWIVGCTIVGVVATFEIITNGLSVFSLSREDEDALANLH